MNPRIHPNGFYRPGVSGHAPPGKKDNPSFNALLQKQLQPETDLKVSKHAQLRLTERNIAIDANTWKSIEAKVSEAKQKGVNDSLVVTNEAALVISTKNNTVITAMNRNEAASQIFTNINGTILME
jgi:flagellar operon protein